MINEMKGSVPIENIKKNVHKIALEDTWNLEALYETNDAWELEYKGIRTKKFSNL